MSTAKINQQDGRGSSSADVTSCFRPNPEPDLAVTAGSLRHQTSSQCRGSRWLQVAIAHGPAKAGAAEFEHAVAVAVQALTRLCLGELNRQVSQLALDVQLPIAWRRQKLLRLGSRGIRLADLAVQ
jgi:hypothetical protein